MNRRILIVDDDPDIRTILSLRLARVGFEVTTATDGLEGLTAVQKSAPCGIVLDLMMPNMGGFEFLVALRCAYRTPPPVFVVSQADDGLMCVRVRDLGAERLIPKGAALGREFALALAQRLGTAGHVPNDNWLATPGVVNDTMPAIELCEAARASQLRAV